MARGAGTVIVKITGDSKGLTNALGQAESRLGKFAKIGGAALATVGVGAVAGLAKLGSNFDDAFDRIRVGTGATGDALKALEGDFKRVLSTTPASFEDTSTAVADLNTRLGLTGEQLQLRSREFLELSRITKTDVAQNVADITRVFGDWSIQTEAQSDALNAMFRASQATGSSINELAMRAVQFGAPLRQMGFGFEESIALLGKFEKEGVNTELVMGSLRIALGKLARDGKEPVAAFREQVEAIKNAGDAGKANALALELFGARAGPDMAAAIREGRLAIGDLLDTVKSGKDTILGAASDTADFSEKWQVFRNRILVGIQPLAARFFDLLGSGMDRLSGVFDRVARFAGSLRDAFARGFSLQGVDQGGVLGFVGRVGEIVHTLIHETLPAVRTAFVEGFRFGEVDAGGVLGVVGTVGSALGGIVETAAGIAGAVGDAASKIGPALLEGAGNVAEFVAPIVGSITSSVTNLAADIISAGRELADNLISGLKAGIEEGDFRGLGSSLGSGIVQTLVRSAEIVGELSEAIVDVFKRVDWVKVGIEAGKAAIPLFIGFAAGILTADPTQIIGQLAKHWQDILFAALIVGLAPARITAKIGEILARIPLAGRLLAWGFEAFVRFSRGLVRLVGVAFRGLGRGFAEALESQAPRIVGGFRGFFTRILTSLKDLPVFAGVLARETMERFASALEDGARLIGRVLGDLPRFIAGFFRGAPRWLLQAGRDIIGGLLAGIRGGLGGGGSVATGFVSILGGIGAAIVGLFSRAGEWLRRAGRDVIGGLVAGMSDTVGGVIEFLAGIPGAVVDAVSDAGSWLVGTGRDTVGGFLAGVAERWRAAVSFFQGVSGVILRLLSGAVGWLLGVGRDIVQGLIQGAQERFQGVLLFFGGLASRIRNAIPDAGRLLFDVGKAIMQGLLDGAKSLLGEVGGFFKDLGTKFIASPIERILSVRSPSKVMAGIGSAVMQGLIVGAERQLDAVKRTFKNVGDAISVAASPNISRVDAPALSAAGRQRRASEQPIKRTGGLTVEHLEVHGSRDPERSAQATMRRLREMTFLYGV